MNWRRVLLHFALVTVGLMIGVTVAIITQPGTAFAPERGNDPAPEPVVVAPEPVTPPSATIVMVGDMMLARTVESAIEKNGIDYPYAKLDGSLFADADVVIGNLETSVRPTRRVESAQLVFDAMPEHVTGLTTAGFTHVSLANNHTDDFGPEVMKTTREAVINAGLVPFGDAYASAPYVAREDVNGIAISLVGFHAFNEQLQPVLDAITAEHDAGRFVIVMPHWGNEYEHNPNTNQTTSAHMMIDAGADAVIGAHPHVVQSTEVYNGKPIVYSLGNFLFDQDFSEETKTGAAARIVITENTVDISFTPIRIIARQMMIGDAAWEKRLADWLKLPSRTLSTTRE